jgi:hypothetical protein
MGIRLSSPWNNVVLRIHFGLVIPAHDDIHPSPKIVMPGLDPGIHAVPRDVAVEFGRESRWLRHPVDARVKPGHDQSETAAKHEIPCLTAYPDADGVKPGHDRDETVTGNNVLRPRPYPDADGAKPGHDGRKS